MAVKLINKQDMERQLSEMWDAVNDIPANDIDRDAAINQAQETENKLRESYRKQELLRDLGPELLASLVDLLDLFERLHSPNAAIGKPIRNEAHRIIREVSGDISADESLKEKKEPGLQEYWFGLVGPIDSALLPSGADFPMRVVINKVIFDMVGNDPENFSSGWGYTAKQANMLSLIAVLEEDSPEFLNINEILKTLQ